MKINLAAGMLTVLLITACSTKPVAVNVPVELPSSFSLSGTVEQAPSWWLSFNDPTLNDLIEQALGNNFSLKSSWDRLRQAKAVYRKTSAELFPTLDGEAEGSHSAAESDGTTTKTDALALGLSAQYELDLWGRIGSATDASMLDMQATEADLDAAAMTLTAEVATTWYELVEQTCSIRLLEKQIETNRKGLEIVSAQFKTGQVSIADVLQQRQLVESKNGEKIQKEAERKQSEHQLTILLGLAPGAKSYQVPSTLTLLPELPRTGIPAELIRQRPDIRSAFLAVQAADKRVAAAIADRFPALRFTISVETSGNYGGDIFSDYIASFASNLVGPIIDGGRRKAEVERTKAVAAEQLHEYAQAILVAAGEVEDALIQEKQQLQYINSLKMQLDLATQSMDQVKERYLKGVENYERVLSALTSLQSLQQSELTAQANILVNRIQLCRSLGSGWDYSGNLRRI